MSLSDSSGGWSEDSLHRWLGAQGWPARLFGSRGHDAAVLQSIAGKPVLCTDQCVEGVHFTSDVLPLAVGAKAVLRTLSDLAAAAATPVGVLLAVRAPRELDETLLQGVIEGAQIAAADYGAEVIGGDLACAQGPWSIAVTAFGSFDLGGQPPGRVRAEPGQDFLVSGPLGGSLGSGRHLRPVPRFDAARVAVEHGATGMMDVSDGLAWDAFRLARTAGVCIEIALEDVPVHQDAQFTAAASGQSPLHHALHDGEDHELLATMPPKGAQALLGQTVSATCGWRRIGRVTPGEGVVLVSGEGSSATREPWRPSNGGWQHGTRS